MILNGYPDPHKRAAYDRSGSDPESRFGGGGFATNPFAGGGDMAFEGEMSPEDLFNMFFGGGGAGANLGAFNNGPSMSPAIASRSSSNVTSIYGKLRAWWLPHDTDAHATNGP
jgi:DnaJ-class molecular chaperone